MIEDLYNVTFDLYSNSLDSSTPDSIGGVSRTVSLTYSNIPSFITPLSAKEAIFFGKNNIQATWRIFCAASYEVNSTDLIYYNGGWYNITYIENAGGSRNHHYEILCIQTKAPIIVYPDSSSSESSSSSSSSYSSSSSSSSSMDSSSSSSSSSSNSSDSSESS